MADKSSKPTPAGVVTLEEAALDAISGGPNRRKFDHIGNVIDEPLRDPATGQFASTAGGSPNV